MGALEMATRIRYKSLIDNILTSHSGVRKSELVIRVVNALDKFDYSVLLMPDFE